MTEAEAARAHARVLGTVPVDVLAGFEAIGLGYPVSGDELARQ